MLKVGGELIIDSTDGYDSKLYVSDYRFMLDGLCPQECPYSPVNQNPEKLERFGIPVEETIPFNQDMLGISNYLSFWGLTDIINVGDRYNARRSAYQPYTRIPGEGLETARRTSILSATKTKETEDRMEDWAKKIQSVRGHVIMSQ